MAEIHAIKAQTTLAALAVFRGQKNHSSLYLCALASECLIDYFADEEVAERSNTDAANVSAMLSLMCAAKLLGLIEGETPGVPDQAWQASMRRRLQGTEEPPILWN